MLRSLGRGSLAHVPKDGSSLRALGTSSVAPALEAAQALVRGRVSALPERTCIAASVAARSARIGRGAAAAVVGPYVGSAWQRAAYASSPRPSSPDAPIVVVDVESNMIDFNDPSFEVHCAVTMDVTGNTSGRNAAALRYNNQPETHRPPTSSASGKAARPMSALVEDLAPGASLVAHNGYSFDLPVLERLGYTHRGALFDTLLMARLYDPDLFGDRKLDRSDFPGRLVRKHSLEAWGLRLGVHKGDFQTTNGDDPFGAWSPAMEDYCEQDVRVTAALFDRTKEVLSWGIDQKVSAYDLEFRVARIINQQCRNGVAVDAAKIATFESRAEEEIAVLEGEIRSHITGWTEREEFIPKKNNQTRGYVAGVPFIKEKFVDFNPNSTQHIARAFVDLYGWEPREFTRTGNAKIDENILAACATEYPLAAALVKYRLLKNIMTKVLGAHGYVQAIHPDTGRVHGYVNTNGTVTGRMSHSQPNLGQVPKPRKDSSCSELIREMFVAPEGSVLVGYDADALELRMLAHYLAAYDDGEYVAIVDQGSKADGTDIHTVNQEALSLPTRDLAKTWKYGWLYGAGALKLGSIAKPMARPEEQERLGKEQQERYFARFPAIRSLKSDIIKARRQAASRAKMENSGFPGYLIGLDGRKLRVKSEHSALNVLLQSAGAIVMKVFLVNLVDLLDRQAFGPVDYKLVLNVHDEVQAEVVAENGPSDPAVEAYIACCDAAMAATRDDLGLHVPLRGEAQVGHTWAETH